MAYRYFWIFIIYFSIVESGPLNLFVNVTIDDRPDLEIVQGDIAFPVAIGPSNLSNRNAYFLAGKWPGGVIPYVIDNASPFTAAHIQTITNSMRKIEQQTNNCIRFVQRTNQPTWVRLYNGVGCYSLFGKAYDTGAQDLSLQIPGCVYQDVVIHELIHAVGFAHEQARPDRDQTVTIQWQNIQTGQEYNFQAYSTSQVTTLNKAYDLGSIMHYRWNAFSKNGQATVLPKDSAIDKSVLGNTQQLTQLDIQKIKAYYTCS